ncbi:amino acid permease [Phanerochaete sordida]|uniref:Amino acid permease n=1 Tax=Phanerochaete sordida TaxID=48140 RepID=A0A9P3G0A9_9APHY|nr:amino acid permease [Phanerochaete sordida]
MIENDDDPARSPDLEEQPLLASEQRRRHYGHEHATEGEADSIDRDDHWADEPHHDHEKRKLGFFSASSLIFNRVIGTGIFATPSVILRSSGSVGLSLAMWLLGALVAACGTAVYIELGTGIPRNGGEKNYLEYIFRRPAFLATCVYAMYAVFIGWQSASVTVFGEYLMHAVDPTRAPPPWAARLASLACIAFAFALHGTHVRGGVRLQNALGAFKLLVLVGIALSGLAVLAGVPGFVLENPPDNFRWSTMWEGTASGGANAFVTGLYNVIWCFIGYSNANYALSEIRDPVRTIKFAAPAAMVAITAVYLLVNIAYFAVVDKDTILNSGRIVAALFFGRLWGQGTERILSAIVALSTLGNVLAVLFSQGRVIQELGKEGILPFSDFFASNEPFDAPMAGMFAQFLVTAFLIIAVPAGDAYLFMLSMSSYPLSLINSLVSGGLLVLHIPHLGLEKTYGWNPPFRAYLPVIAFFFVSNLFLAFAPLVPPAHGFEPYQSLPYWLHVFTGFALSSVGVIYWYVWTRWLPRTQGYRVVPERVVKDGITRTILRKVFH